MISKNSSHNVLEKKVLLKFCKMHKKTSVLVSFLITLQAPVSFAKFIKTVFLQNTFALLLLKIRRNLLIFSMFVCLCQAVETV